jgi:hypothetical protein
MNKKTSAKAATASSRKQKGNNPARKAVNAFEKQLALIGYVKGQDWPTELIEELQNIELELVTYSALLKSTSLSSNEESDVVDRLRSLEIKRFQLLGQVHGNRVNDYHLLTSYTANQILSAKTKVKDEKA